MGSSNVDIGTVQFASLDLDKPATEQIFVGLRNAILRMELPPGCLISETEIGEQFGASRTPVRAALTQLRNDGLIVTRPSRGNYVAKLSEKRIRAAQFIRESLELAIVKKLSENGLSDLHRDKLEQTLDLQKDTIGSNLDLEFHTHDDAFHIGLAAATDMEPVEKLYVREKVNLDRLRGLGMDNSIHKAGLWQQHRDILDAVIAQDPVLAVANMQTHLGCIVGKLKKLMQDNQDYFE